MTKADAYNEDWPKRTWDVRTPSGALVDDLTGLAATYGLSEAEAAQTLLASPAYASAPPQLQDEVQALTSTDQWFTPTPNRPEEARPMTTNDDTESKGKGKPFGGGDKPPEINTGSFVSWSGGKGRVDLVVTNGKVPGVEGDVEGTSKSPAARVVVWENGKPTRKKIAKSTHTLKRIAPLKKEGKSLTGSSALVERLSLHHEVVAEMGMPTVNKVTGRALKTVYDRGIKGWPGPALTTLSAEDWALGRVDHFLKVAQGEIETKDAAGNDTDLLVAEHPMAPSAQALFDDRHERGEEAQRLAMMAQETLNPGAADVGDEEGDEERVVLSQEEVNATLARLGIERDDDDGDED